MRYNPTPGNDAVWPYARWRSIRELAPKIAMRVHLRVEYCHFAPGFAIGRPRIARFQKGRRHSEHGQNKEQLLRGCSSMFEEQNDVIL